jgi:hypothetical protein
MLSRTVASSEVNIVPQSDCAEVTKSLTNNKFQQMKIMNGILHVVNGNFLVFERDGVKLEAPVAQPDYGQVTGLRLAANGEIYAIGDQRSYKVILAATADSVALNTSELPVLYRKPCCWLGGLLGACQETNAIFSDAVSAVFLSGYDARGVLKSYVYGLTDEVLDLSSEPSPHYQRDCGRGFVVMVGKSGASIMDKSGNMKPFEGEQKRTKVGTSVNKRVPED